MSQKKITIDLPNGESYQVQDESAIVAWVEKSPTIPTPAVREWNPTMMNGIRLLPGWGFSILRNPGEEKDEDLAPIPDEDKGVHGNTQTYVDPEPDDDRFDGPNLPPGVKSQHTGKVTDQDDTPLEEMSKDQLRARYEEKFGQAAPSNIKVETLIERLEASDED